VKTLRTGLVPPFGFFATTSPANLLNPGYTVAYLGAVDTFTFNFTTQIERTRLYGEYIFSPNKPVNFNAADLVFAVVGPQFPTPLRAIYNATPLGGIMPGADRLEVGNLDLGISQLMPQAFSSAFNASALNVDAEFGLKQVYNLPSDLRFGRSEVFGQGPVAGFPCGSAGETPQQLAVQCTSKGYVTSNAYGVRLNAALTYENVFIPGLKLTPSIGAIWDMSGWSYDGIFIQGRVLMPLKIRADYGKNYFAEVVLGSRASCRDLRQPVGSSVRKLRRWRTLLSRIGTPPALVRRAWRSNRAYGMVSPGERAVTLGSPKRDGPALSLGNVSPRCGSSLQKALRQSRTEGRRRRMTSFKLFGAALILSTAFATPVFAQIPEPGDYSFSQEPGLSAVYRPSGDLRIGSTGPTGGMTVQPGRVGGWRLPTRSRRARYISPTRAY